MRLPYVPRFCVLFIACSAALLTGAETDRSCEELLDSIWSEMGDGHYEIVLERVATGVEAYPENTRELELLAAIAYGQLGRQSEGLEIWAKWHDKGEFFSLRAGDRLFENYEGFEGFEEAVRRDRELRLARDERSELEYEVVLPREYDAERAYPLLYVCHGGGGNIARAKMRWQSDYLSENFITVYLQSYLHRRSDSLVWRNDAKTREGLRRINFEVWAKHRIAPGKVFIGGMSNGGMIALQVALDDIFHVNGFVANCPIIPDYLDAEEVKRAKLQNKRGVIITGSEDYSLPSQQCLKGVMDAEGFSSELTVIEGMGHAIPKDFHARVEEAMEQLIVGEDLIPSLDVSYIGNEGFLFEAYGSKVLIDGTGTLDSSQFMALSKPLQEKFRKAEAPFDDIDLILVTHRHADHFDPELTIASMSANDKTLFVANSQVIRQMYPVAGYTRIKHRIIEVNNQRGSTSKLTLSGIRMECINVPHGPYMVDGINRHEKVDNLIYVVDFHGMRILHPGDVTVESNVERFAELDLDIAFLLHFDRSETTRKWIDDRSTKPTVVPIHISPAKWDETRVAFEESYPDATVFKDQLEKRTFFKSGDSILWANEWSF